MKQVFSILVAMLIMSPAFADDDKPKSGAQNHTPSKGINWKKFHKKQHKATQKRRRDCNIWLTL